MLPDRTLASRSWLAPEHRIESLLFGAVGLVTFACMVLVAARLLAAA